MTVTFNCSTSAGLRKISGLHHSNGIDISKRSRQLIWKAAVESSNSASRLALQVGLMVLTFTLQVWFIKTQNFSLFWIFASGQIFGPLFKME